MTTNRIRRRAATVPVAALIACLALSSAASAKPLAYVTQSDDGVQTPNDRVSVVDLATNAEVGAIKVGHDPTAVALSPDGTRAYVADDNGVTVVDTATNTVLTSIPAPGATRLAINPGGTRVYVTRDASDDVKVISTATNAVVATIGVGDDPRPIVVNGAGTRAYVGNTGTPDSISILDLTNNTSLGTASGGASLDRPENLAITPNGATVYAANFGASAGGTTVSVLITATNAIVAALPVGTTPTGLTVNPSGTRLYVAARDSAKVTLVSTTSNTVTGFIPLTFAPTDIAFAPQGNRALIAGDDATAVADTTTNTLSAQKATLTNATRAATVPVQTPTAALAAVAAAAGSPTAFDASGSSAKFGAIARYDYDFGDGSSAADAGPTPTHVYAQPGTYTATVTVTNDCDPAGVLGPLTIVHSGSSPTCSGFRTKAATTQAVVTGQAAPAPPAADPPAPPVGAPGPIPPGGAPRPGLKLTGVAVDRACLGKGKRAGKDLKIRYTLSDPARVSFVIQRRKKPAAAARTTCPARLKPAKRERFTTVTTRAKSSAVAGKGGRASVRLRKLLGKTKLRPGAYRVVVQAARADGSRSRSVAVPFLVLAKTK